MIIYLGADHRGFQLKEHVKGLLHNQGYETADTGALKKEEGDDYPDFAKAVAERVAAEPNRDKGILFCGSGAGVDIVANKIPGVRSVLGFSTDQVYSARHDDDVNVLSIAADFTDEAEIDNMVRVFMATPFSGEENHKRRLKKIASLEGN
ncbi:MAG: RpiB/LacA/LacB family sugar-phosphate isomerase [Patescibacteria group bacterium]